MQNLGENVFVVGIDPSTYTKEIPDTLKIYSRFEDFIFTTHETGLIIYYKVERNPTMTKVIDYLADCFKSLVFITAINTLR